MANHYRLEIPQQAYGVIDNLREAKAELEAVTKNLVITGDGDRRVDILEGDVDDDADGKALVNEIFIAIQEYKTFIEEQLAELRGRQAEEEAMTGERPSLEEIIQTQVREELARTNRGDGKLP